MTYRLFKVHVQRELEVVVVAEDASAARRFAVDQAYRIFSECDPDTDAWAYGEGVGSGADLPQGWHGEELPFEPHDLPKELKNRTVDEWLAPTDEPRGPDEPIPDVPGQVVMPFAEGDST